MDFPIIQTNKINSINTLTTVIEPTYMNTFSILAYDEEGEIWNEKFADSLQIAINKRELMINEIMKQYH